MRTFIRLIAAPPAAWRWFVWSLYAAAWTVALLIPIPSFAGPPIDRPWYFHLFGKSLHVAAYAVLTVLSGWLRVPRPRRWWLIVFISFHGMATEYLQQFVERGSSWSDVGLDHIGLVIGLLASWKWWFR